MAIGTTLMPPVFWINGNTKSNDVAPPEPMADKGKRAMINGITANAKNSRKRSLKNATLPTVGPKLFCKTDADNEYQPKPELTAKPSNNGRPFNQAANMPPKNDEIMIAPLKIKP